MGELDLEAIKARAGAATPGPWWHYGDLAHEVYPDGEGDDIPAVVPEVPRVADAEFIAHAREDVPALIAEVERLNTWSGLIELLDQYWPEDTFPTVPDREDRDIGPRIVSLIRWVDRLTVERDRLAAVVERVQDEIASWGEPDSSAEADVTARMFAGWVRRALDGEAT